MIKLNLAIGIILQRVNQKNTQSIHQLYQDITRGAIQTAAVTIISQQPSPTLTPISPPHPSFRISSKNPPNIQSQRILNKQSRKSNFVETTLKQQQQQQMLLSRKQKLLTELNEINHSLKSHHDQSRITRSSKPQLNTQEMVIQAQDLVKRMKMHRKEQAVRRRESIEQLNRSISKSIEQFNESLEEEERIKELKRKEIQQRINRRKINAIERGVSVNMSQSVLQHFIAQATQKSQDQPTDFYSIRINSESNQPSQMNPENYSSQVPHLPHIKTEHSKHSLNSSAKSYERSPFLERVLKEEERQKKVQYLKFLEKKRVNMKHKEYAEKMRGKAQQYALNSLFVT